MKLNVDTSIINIKPGSDKLFLTAKQGPFTITNGYNESIVFLSQNILQPCMIQSFDDHLEIYPIGEAELAELGNLLLLLC